MGLLFQTSFDHYTTITQRFDSSSGFGMNVNMPASGLHSSSCLTLQGDGVWDVIKNVANSATLYGSFMFKIDSLGQFGAKYMFASALDSGTRQSYLVYRTDGFLEVHRGGYSQSFGSGTVVATSTVRPFTSFNTWYHVEWMITTNNTTGATTVWVNGVQVLNASSLNTRSSANNFANQFSLARGNQSGSFTHFFDDFVLRDDAQNGESRVVCLFPTGVGAVDQWTANTGTTATATDETAPNDDTDYMSESTVGETTVFDYNDLASTATIIAVCPVTRSKKDVSGTADYKHAVRSGGTVYTPGATISPTTSYAYYSDILTQDPNTSAAWTVSNFNSAQIGAQRTA